LVSKIFLLLRKGQFGEKLEKEVAISYHLFSLLSLWAGFRLVEPTARREAGKAESKKNNPLNPVYPVK